MLLFLAVSLWILAISFRDRPKESLAGLGVAALGVPFFYYWNRKKQ